MTPEEAVSRIRDALQRLTQEFHASAADYDENGRLDAEALAVVRRVAMLAEREACAKLVEDWMKLGLSGTADGWSSYPDDEKIAAAIRRRP